MNRKQLIRNMVLASLVISSCTTYSYFASKAIIKDDYKEKINTNYLNMDLLSNSDEKYDYDNLMYYNSNYEPILLEEQPKDQEPVRRILLNHSMYE